MPAEREIRADFDRDTMRVRPMRDLLQSGQADKAKRHLPPERVYPVNATLARRLLLG